MTFMWLWIFGTVASATDVGLHTGRLQSLKPTALESTSTTSILWDVPAHILQWLTNNLGYIQDMGFNAVWILPAVKNVDGQRVRRWLPRASTIPSSPLLCPHFDLSTELKNLSEALLLCGMYFTTQFFWAGYMACVGVFALGEVETDEPAYAVYYRGPLDAVIDYPAFYNLTLPSQAPRATSLSSPSSLCCWASPHPPLTAFLKNHNKLHFLSLTMDGVLRKNTMGGLFVGDGILTWYYGQEQGTRAADPRYV
ncbi:hypothetical protein B0H14DRAFT_3525707 [Mycena olivaceomarginata]|nr:hypothetical protein B0H14DRAFT_3525707 [Mycena olivaceomarginata]